MEIILGVIVSLVAQTSKKVFGTSEYSTLATVAGLSVASAVGYHYLGSADLLGGLKEILTTAGAFYAFVIARFPKASNTPVSE